MSHPVSLLSIIHRFHTPSLGIGDWVLEVGDVL
uniref:Uncharacterized protein LOC105110429 n=1 Tax=Rhizophora mucronata TaxID=61149 RepID=A0A2P2KN71_RHIMU